MADLKHTPGPWRIHGDLYIEADDNLILARVEKFMSINGHATQKANQRLIAAAPDLLAALKECVIVMRRMDPAQEMVTDDSPLMKLARLAIERATGEGA